ncbi:hypothetical protein LL972_15410 [Xanthomonas campestris pv. asclepiadis]|uniref:hypothetical protein n=1 Tax=Xanthomonas campestris TaxID=339 RepID=UPI001E55BBE8|nr:hypothetical protein [Xanthomonas campestris]MCC4617371.1 hypothetical protein [Xanthomonas campestris pv. asclepiadis]
MPASSRSSEQWQNLALHDRLRSIMQRQTLFFVGSDAGAGRSKDSAPAKCSAASMCPNENAAAEMDGCIQSSGAVSLDDSRFPIPDSRASVAHPETNADYPVAPEAMG